MLIKIPYYLIKKEKFKAKSKLSSKLKHLTKNNMKKWFY